MRLIRPCFLANCLYPEAVFRIKTTEKLLYLTFDDGPDPESTPHLLSILDKHNITSVFFCDGRAAEKYPELMARIISKGHLIGNHGYAHPDGWMNSPDNYASDILTASVFTSGNLFRPPYGHIRFGQYRKLKKTYKIIFWDLMPFDFDRSFGSKNSLRILKKKIRPGSIIVLHDTPRSTFPDFLPEFIVFSISKGYRFELPALF